MQMRTHIRDDVTRAEKMISNTSPTVSSRNQSQACLSLWQHEQFPTNFRKNLLVFKTFPLPQPK